MLLMKKVFFDAIRSGRKTTTLRYWPRRMVRPESLHTIPGLGKVRIDSAEPTELAKLTDDDAKTDGFENIQALKDALDELYPPDARQDRTLYLVRFTLIADGKSSRTAEPSGSADESAQAKTTT